LLFGLADVRVQRVVLLAGGTRQVHVRTACRAAAACPRCRVVSSAVKGKVTTTPRDIPYGTRRIAVVWHKRRWRCREPLCGWGSFTETIPEIPARARTTRRLRRAIGAAVGDANRALTEPPHRRDELAPESCWRLHSKSARNPVNQIALGVDS
jgi:transposase